MNALGNILDIEALPEAQNRIQFINENMGKKKYIWQHGVLKIVSFVKILKFLMYQQILYWLEQATWIKK